MFSVEESTIIKMYCGFSQDRKKVLSALHEILPLIEEPEIVDTVTEIIKKVTAMTPEAFSALDISNTLNSYI